MTRPAVLSVADAAAYLSVSVRTMQRLSAECGQDGLPVVAVSPGRRGFRVADLDRYIDSRVIRPGRVA